MDSFVPVPPETPVQWPDGRVYVVRQHRCLGCGSLELVQRDTHEKHKDHKHAEGRYSPEDGLRMTVDERG